MKKFPKIRRLGDSENDGILESDENGLFVQEKLDGANFRFTLQDNIEEEYHDDDRDIVFGSRNIVYKNEKDRDSAFTHAVEYVRENMDIDMMKMLNFEFGPLTFYGEAMHPHTIDYNWDETPSFVGFDIYSERYESFHSPTAVEEYMEEVGLPSVTHHPLDVVKGGFEVPESEFYDGPAEGVVVKNTATGQRAKIRSKKFKEMHESAKNKAADEYNPPDATILAHQFATEARILKQIHKYEDSGEKIRMGMMEELWRDVFDDIIEEEYDTIFLGNHTINTKDFRSEVASRTAEVLQDYLSRPGGSTLNEVTA